MITTDSSTPQPGFGAIVHAMSALLLGVAILNIGAGVLTVGLVESAVLGIPDFMLLLVLSFVVGGLASPLYPLCVAEANDWLAADELVPAPGL